jgi:hypothetical protein
MSAKGLVRGTVVGWQALGAAVLLVACSASSGESGTVDEPAGASGAAGSSNPAKPGGSSGAGGGLVIEVPSGGGGSGASGGVASCATQQKTADVERQPVDIIVVIDNSGSMQDEIDAVEQNINVNFTNILQQSGIDYRVILLSRHEKKGRQTSICVTAPLSGNAACPPTPDLPAFTERFYQYSLKVDSLNSLVLILSTLDGMAEDEFDLAPMGWGAWLRPEASKVFLEITDDNSTEMSAADFEAQLFAKSTAFGSVNARRYRFHSIIGIGEKATVTEPWLPTEPMQTSLCTGNGNTIENHGPVYQELSIATGGLRFPLCQFTAFDRVFDTIAKDVASHAAITCNIDIPQPPSNEELDLSKVAVSLDPGDGSGPKTFGQAKTAAECVPDAFYIDAAKNQIVLCDETCAAAQLGKNPKLDVLFTCEPTYVDPPK